MIFRAAVSQHPLPTHASGEVIGSILEEAGPGPDLAILVVTGAFAGALDDMDATVRQLIGARMTLSLVSSSILTGDGMISGSPGAALFIGDWGGRLRHGSHGARSVEIEAERFGDGWRIRGTDALVGVEGTLLLFVAHPEFPTARFLGGLGHRSPDLLIAGGTPNAPVEPASPGVIVGGRRIETGAAGIVVPAAAPVRPFTTQGTRPVGAPYVVTASSPGFVHELGGRPALDRVSEEIRTAMPQDRRALTGGMNLGIVLSERDGPPDPDAVLVRRLPGADRRTGSVAIEADVEIGTTVQLQARDRRSAEADLRRVLTGGPTVGGLVFVGDRRLGDTDGRERDASVLSAHTGPRRVVGIGCSRVIGPVASRNWVHERAITGVLFEDR